MVGESNGTAPGRYRVWYGRNEPPRELRELRAGPLTVQLDGGDLRYVLLGDVELVRRLYAAARDPNWNTIPPLLSNLDITAADNHFTVRFDCRHHQGDIDYNWHGTITGTADGTITYDMDGVAGQDFQYNKIGLNIHHPMLEAAGQPYAAQMADGPISGDLPDTIGPQRIVDGIDVPLFPPFSSLTIHHHGIPVQFDFEGALAEMEDQRNWSDASFKTYMPPQMKGFPYPARAGQRFHQKITVSLPESRQARLPRSLQLEVRLGEPMLRSLPHIGLGMSTDGGDLAPREVDLLRPLHLDHLRADLRLTDQAYADELHRAVRAATSLGCGLELAIFLGGDAETKLDSLAAVLKHVSVPIRRALVYRVGEEATAGRWLLLARQRLSPALPDLPLAGGTNVYFNELNRDRPDIALMDAVAYSVNPQIHAFDELSLAEAVAAQAEQVRSARTFSGALPIVVSPITLRPRFNAVATDPDLASTSVGLPWEVDVRQTSLFGCAWTVGSLKYLAESGAASVTYYETTGWCGLIETEAGSRMPGLFPSKPGMVFPLYHVFADAGAWHGGEVVRCSSSHPLLISALAVRHRDVLGLVVANLSAEPRQVTIAPVPPGRADVRRLDETTVQAAMFQPLAFRARHATVEIQDRRLRLELAPYATLRVELRDSQ